MAIRVEQITTLEQISKIIWDQQYQSTLMRNRSPYLYRGLPNSNYHLVTSLRRNCKEKKNDIELAILRNFVKYAAFDGNFTFHAGCRSCVSGVSVKDDRRGGDRAFYPRYVCKLFCRDVCNIRDTFYINASYGGGTRKK